MTAPVLASSSESEGDRGFLSAVRDRASLTLHRLSSHLRGRSRAQEVVVEEEVVEGGGQAVRQPKKKKHPAWRRLMNRARRARKRAARRASKETSAARRHSSSLSAGASAGSPPPWEMAHDEGKPIEYPEKEGPAPQETQHYSYVPESSEDESRDEILVVEDEGGTSWGQSLATSPSPLESPLRLSLGEREEQDDVRRVTSARFASDEEMEGDNWPVLPAEVEAFRREFDDALEVVGHAKDSAAQLGALRTALLGSQDFAEFVKRHRTLVGVVDGIGTVFVRTINFSLYGALGNFKEFAESAEGSADWREEAEMENVSFNHLSEDMTAVLEEAKQRAALTSLDCYELPFLGRTGHFIGDLDELVRVTGIEADQVLAAYQHFYGTLVGIIKEIEAIAPELAAMPEAYDKVIEGGSQNEYETRKEALGAAWQRLQALFDDAHEAITAYREVVEQLDDNDTGRADLWQHWKAQFRADVNGMAALRKAFTDENWALFQEFVVPSANDVFGHVVDSLFGLDDPKVTWAQLTSEIADVKEAIREAEALHTALVTDAAPVRRIWGEMLEDKEMDEAKFVQGMGVLAEEEDWFAAKLQVLMDKLEAAQARLETAKATIKEADPWKFMLETEEIRLLTLLGRKWNLESSLPPLLDDKALAQTALIHAHPDKFTDMHGHLKDIELDYISDEAHGSRDEEARDEDLVHAAFDRLHKHQMALQDWDMLRLKGAALEQAYRDAIRGVPGSAEAFLVARSAFDRSWRLQYLAQKAVWEDLQALEEAIEGVNEARKHEWQLIVDSYQSLLQPAAVKDLGATASQFTLGNLRRRLADVGGEERDRFLRHLLQIEMTLKNIEDSLAWIKKKRLALQAAANEADAIKAVSAFVRAGGRLLRAANRTIAALNELRESPEYLAYREAAMEDDVAAVLLRLDDEACLELGFRMGTLQDAIPEACAISDDELATVPGISGNDRLFDDLRATIPESIVYDDLDIPEHVVNVADEVVIEPIAGPSEASHDAASAEPSPPKTPEEEAFLQALTDAHEAIALADQVIINLRAVRNDLLESPDGFTFDQHHRTYALGRQAFREAMVQAEALFNAASRAWVDFQGLFTWSEGALYGMGDMIAAKDGMALLGDAIKALRAKARGRAVAELSTLDCYGLPFLRQAQYFLKDLGSLTKQYGMQPDPALQAYQSFTGALEAATEAAKKVVPGLVEMPRLFEALADTKEKKPLAAFLRQRDDLYAAWQSLQALLRQANLAHQAYAKALNELPAAKQEIVQRWQEQYQADTSALEAFAEPIETEYRMLYLEFVAPTRETLLSRLPAQAPDASGEAADGLGLERVNAMAIAMSNDAKYLGGLWSELQVETVEDAFEEKMEKLLEHRHRFDDQMAILRRHVEAVDADRTIITVIEEMLPPPLNKEALTQTAFIRAHPDRLGTMLDSLRASGHDYIEDEAPAEGDVDVDPVYMAYGELFSHQAGLQDWELLRWKAAALEQAYENALKLVPGSVDAFLAARSAFDRSWEVHLQAAQAIHRDSHALQDALRLVDETRQQYWASTLEYAEGLLLPDIMDKLEAAASKFTLQSLFKHAFSGQHTPNRKEYLKLLDNLQNIMRGLEAGLSAVSKIRRTLLASVDDAQAIPVAKGFAMATKGLIGGLANAKEQYRAIQNWTYQSAEKSDKGAPREVARLDEEALRMHGARLAALDEAIDDTCVIPGKQLAEIPAVIRNDQLLKELLSIIQVAN